MPYNICRKCDLKWDTILTWLYSKEGLDDETINWGVVKGKYLLGEARTFLS